MDWDWGYINAFTKDKERYVTSKYSRLSILSMMDEDYDREEGILNRRKAINIIFQCEYIIERISNYL